MQESSKSRKGSKKDKSAQRSSENISAQNRKPTDCPRFTNLATYYKAKQKEFGITNPDVLDFCAAHGHSMNQTALSRLKNGEVNNALYYVQWGAVLWDAVKVRCKDRIVEFMEGVYDNLLKDLDAHYEVKASEHRTIQQELQQKLQQVEAQLADEALNETQRAHLVEEAEKLRKSIVYQGNRIH